MAYQETTKTSYGQRLTGSIKGIGSGFVMFIIGTVLLFWNEGNFVKTKKSIQEAESVMIRVQDVSNVDPSLNGKLIHATAFANTDEVLTDGLFGISETAISISRKVEYYQFKENARSETKDKIGGGQETTTTYTYEKDWAYSPVNSESFHDPAYKASNFVLTTVEDKSERAKNVSFGGYKLPSFIISSIGGSIPAEAKLSEDEIQQWEKVIGKDRIAPNDTTKMVHVNGNVVYFGKSSTAPAIGDVRITLTKILPADISIIAKVYGTTFEEYYAKNGKTFSSVAMGNVSPDKMFADAHSSNSMWTWVLRLLGIFLVIGGLKAMFSILPTLFKVLPFLGNIVGAGVGLVCTVFGGAWSLVIIAISWLWYRPLIGILFLAVAIAGIWFLNKRSKEKKAAAAAATATVAMFFAGLMMFASCSDGKNDNNGNGGGNGGGGNGGNGGGGNNTPIEVVISGAISHTDYTPGQTGTITFNRFPATVAEFKAVREKIGEEPHGAVALQIMAYEMFRRNKTIGEECIRLNSTTINVMTPLNRLKELFGTDANYARPYQMAAFLKGATPENGYNPTKPYTIEVRVHAGNTYQYSNIYQTDALYLEVLTKGKDKGAEQVTVLKTLKSGEPSNGKYFIVEACSGLYASVKEKSFSVPFNGLD
jgi:hypothetical protein